MHNNVNCGRLGQKQSRKTTFVRDAGNRDNRKIVEVKTLKVKKELRSARKRKCKPETGAEYVRTK